jgi:hypothetical protein
VTLRLLPRIRAALTPTRVAAIAVFAVALGLRLLWVARVDSPFDNIHSDMAGYINRALLAAYGGSDPLPVRGSLTAPDPHAVAAAAAGMDPWTTQCPIYPPGAHLVYAAEMKLVGWSHHAAMLILHCAWGAVVAPCAMLLALRIVRRLGVAVAFGLAMALWYPLLAFSGFFSSEQPYAGAIALSAWLLVRQIERGEVAVAVALGVASSIAYLVRPQIVMTLAALSLVGLYVLVRRPARAPQLRVSRLLLAGCIFLATVGWGAARYHRLTGRWGLISDNSALTRLWADTNYGKVRAVWTAPDGAEMSFFFESPPKAQTGLHRELTIEGYLGDSKTLEAARKNEVLYMTTGERLVRWASNVRLLYVDSDLWPDDDGHQRSAWRRDVYSVSRWVALGVLAPLALLGIASCVRRPTAVALVCTAHVLTMVLVAAFFYAEQRYRVPYDIFLGLLALEGARGLTVAIRGRIRLGGWRDAAAE